jgi:integrase
MRGRGTGYIVKKPGGGYFVGWSVRGKPYRVAVSTVLGIPPTRQTKQDAQRALDSMRGRAGQFVHRRNPGLGPTVAALLDDYRRVLVARNTSSIKEIDVAHRHWKQAYGDLPAEQVTASMLLSWVEQMKARQPRPMMPATIATQIGHLRAALRYASQQDPPRLERLPHFPRIKVNNARQAVLTPEEFAAIYPHLPEGLRGPFALAYIISWRKGELLTLTWAMIDRHEQVIRLPVSKNGKPRVVPISPEMKTVLQEAWNRQVIGCPYVFHHKGRQIKRSWSEYQWHLACGKAGVEDRRFHDTRRAAVQRMIHGGVPDKVVMDISGHTSMSMLYRYAIKSTASMQAALATPALPKAITINRNRNRVSGGRGQLTGDAQQAPTENLWKTGI